MPNPRTILALCWFVVFVAGIAVAGDCSEPSDCEATTGYLTTISVLGGLTALGAGLFLQPQPGTPAWDILHPPPPPSPTPETITNEPSVPPASPPPSPGPNMPEGSTNQLDTPESPRQGEQPVGPITPIKTYGTDSPKPFGADGFPSDSNSEWEDASSVFKVGNAEATAIDYLLNDPKALYETSVMEALKEPQTLLGVTGTGIDFLADMGDLAAKGELTTDRILDVTAGQEYKIVFQAAFPEIAAIDAVTGGSLGDEIGKFGAGSMDAFYALGKTGLDASQGNLDGSALQNWIAKANAGQFGYLGKVALDPMGALNALRTGDINQYHGP